MREDDRARSGLTHAEWSELTDAANQGTDELLIEAVERIIAARLFAIEAERDQWKDVAHDGAFQQARAEALARQAAAVEALADKWSEIGFHTVPIPALRAALRDDA